MSAKESFNLINKLAAKATEDHRTLAMHIKIVQDCLARPDRRYWWIALPIALGLFIGQGVWFLFTH